MDNESLRQEIHRVFDGVRAPATIDEMLLPLYRASEDACAMAAALVGKPWQSLAIHDLFYHREMLGTLSAAAYRAYLPAYLEACLATDDPSDRYGADIREYTVGSLAPWPYLNDQARSLTAERLSLLDDRQRAVVALVLRHLESRWHMADAGEALRNWFSVE
jgi:hypothetical protein